MQTERFAQVEQLVQAALALTPSQWPAFLHQSCAGDHALRAEVESLLKYQRDADNFIEAPMFALPADLLSSLEAEDEAFEGKLIGPYQVVGELGRGGMGAVYLAARADDQYQKQVAIKLVKAGLDSKEIRRRFIHERQILASLDHPNIARLLDGGATDEGLPYLVMDYIAGVPINEYCDAHQRSTVDRLKLFRSVCGAVHYAHQRLVVHRDLKPGNILVTEEEVPKLLDFGIAKLLDPTSVELAGHTVTQLGVMTPEYASPEQLKGEAVTTSTDVYSLGVVLYELLTGHRPYRIKSRRPDEMARIICEEEPERPSTAIASVEELPSANGEAAQRITPESVSGARDSQPEKLRRLLDGDLDNIVLMAMRKEPQRRYASVEQFSEDIRRHLEGLPVIARKDTFGYRGAKFVKRHRVGMAAAVVIVLSLIAGMAATIWQSRVSKREAKIAAEQRDRARIETAKSGRINAFLQEMLGFSDPSWNSPNTKLGHELTVREAFDEAAKRAESELADQPEVLAEVERTIGNTYRGQGRLDAAETKLRSAVSLYRKTTREDSPELAVTLMNLGYVISLKGQPDVAEDLLQQALAIYRKELAAGEPVDYLSFSETLGVLGNVKRVKGDTSAAERFYQESLEYGQKLTGKDRIMVATALINAGALREDRGDLDGAQALYRNALAEWRKFPGGEHFETGACLEYLGINLRTKGEYAEAEKSFREAVAIFHRVQSDESPFATVTAAQFADLLYYEGKYSQAEKEVRGALEIQQRTLAGGSPYFATSWIVLGKILTQTGKALAGEKYLRDALAMRIKTVKQGHWSIAVAQGALGECLTVQKRYADAEPLLLESYDDLKQSQGEQHPRTLEARQRLTRLYDAWKRPSEAARYR